MPQYYSIVIWYFPTLKQEETEFVVNTFNDSHVGVKNAIECAIFRNVRREIITDEKQSTQRSYERVGDYNYSSYFV